MRGILKPGVIALAAALAAPAFAGDAKLLLELDVGRRREHHRIEIVELPDGVEVRYDLKRRERKTSREGRFDAKVRAGLLKAWGADSFAVTGWPAEDCLTSDLRFTVESGPDRRVVCRDEKRVRRLLDFKGAVTVLLQ